MYDHGGMNRFYRLVWSEASQCFIPIPEVSKSRGKRSGGGVAITAALALAGCVSQAALAGSAALVGVDAPHNAIVSQPYALPTGGQVVGGNATIHQDGNSQTINQTSRAAAINWQTFNVGSKNTVTFVQPHTTSVALNRVVGNQASQIYGVLKANGQVFLINPNGVLFAKGSQVSAAGIMASTRDMKVDDFMAGNYKLAGSGSGSVNNEGSITVANGGFVALIGAQVVNNGDITAREGDVRLAAANEVTLKIENGGLLELTTQQGALDALAANGGLIKADGGRIFLTAEALDHLTKATVNNTGIIEAQTVVNKNGKIVLLGDMEVGTTIIAGALDASAPEGGNGGFIETSAAHVQIADGAQITTQGQVTGKWLIDPVDFTVAATGGDMTGSSLSTALGNNNVTIQSTSGAVGINGDVIINDAVTWSSNTLTLNAQGDIHVNQSIAASGTGALALEYGQASTDGLGATYVLADGVSIELPAGQNFSTQKGTNGLVETYTVITNLGAASDQNSTTLQGMKGNLAGLYVLGNDINASATASWNQVGPESLGFDPVGVGSIDPNTQIALVFTGKFDGLGHTISNLNISRSSRDHVGLFGVVAAATIQNVTLSNASIKGNNHVGALVGTSGVNQNLDGSVFTNIHSSGSIETQGDGGGLLGWLDSARVDRATSSADVGPDSESFTASNLGGIIGSAFETLVSNASASGTVTGQSTVGGLIGLLNGGSLINVFATGIVEASDSTGGGLVGFGRGIFLNLSASGNVTGGSHLGGLFGSMEGDLDNGNAIGVVSGSSNVGGLIGMGNGNIAYSSASGDVTGSSEFVGGLVGRSYANISDSNSTSNVTGNERVGGLVGESFGNVSNSAATGSVGGSNWVGGLIGFNGGDADTVEASGAVNGDFFVGGLIGENKLGSVSHGSAGGTVIGTGDKVGGLIGNNKLGFVENSSYSGLVSGANAVGSLIGFNGGTVSMSNSDSNVSGVNNVGGLIGENEGAVNDSHATGNVSGNGSVGGLMGHGNGGGTILNSYATGAVTGTGTGIGGLAGHAEGSISNSYATGNVSGSGQVGGLAGYSSGSVTGSVNVATAIGVVNGSGDAVGGLIGESHGQVNTVSASGNVSGQDNVGGLIGDNYELVISGSASGNVVGINRVGGLIGTSRADVQTGSATGSVSGQRFIGGLIGDSRASVDNSTAIGSVTGDYAVGGLVGFVFNEDDVISDSSATGAVIGSLYTVGGLVGENYGTVQNSFATGNVTGGDYIGGLVGDNYGVIDTSQASGNVMGDEYIGGLAGYMEPNSTIIGSSASGNVIGIKYAGGLVGGSEADSLITASSATGTVSAETYAGGFIGYSEGLIEGSQAHGVVATTGDTAGGFAGENRGTISSSLATGDVTGAEYVGGLVGDNYGTVNTSQASGNVAGDSYVGGLVGYLDEEASIIDSSASGTATATDYVGGLLGYSDSDTVISGSTATGIVTGTDYIGGLVGSNSGAISGSNASGSISGNAAVGGLVGFNDGGEITGSSTTSDVTASGEGAGGFIGVNNGIVTTATASGAVMGSEKVGGLIGDAQSGADVSASTATGAVVGSHYVGGFIGMLQAEATVEDSHATGAVQGNGDEVGGFVGHNAGAIQSSDATGVVSGVDEIGGFAGRNIGSITEVSAVGDVTSFGQGQHAAGGLIGFNSGTVMYAIASNAVFGDTRVGGLIGENSGTVSYAFATGTVQGSTEVGGFVGVNAGAISFASASGDTQGLANVGGFFGVNIGSIFDAYATGNVAGELTVGGFGGINIPIGTLEKVYETGNITVTGTETNVAAGGLVGRNDGTINIAYANGSVTGTATSEQIGGLIGYHDGAVTDAYATGATSGANIVGGLIGEMDSVTATATNVYAKGAVASVGGARGALIGKSLDGTVTNGYWDIYSTNLVTAVGDNQGGVLTGAGFTTPDFKQQSNYAGFDFGNEGNWKNYNGDTTPLLTAWLTGLVIDVADTNLSYVYNGLGRQDNVSSLAYSVANAPSSGHLFGVAHYDTAKNVGVYTDITGIYSDQQAITSAM